MPSDSNGVYSLPNGYLAITGETIQASQHNPPLEDLSAAMTQRLMRSGAAPMTGPLKAVDGTAGAPGLTFASATSSGFYKTPNGIGVAVGGAQVAEFGVGGITKGILPIGLGPLPWSRLAAPAGWVLCYGQTLNRADYPDLWEVAQDEIAAGNIFYNNGNGSTTFGIGDLRGRVIAGLDNMGGSNAARLSLIASTTLGGAGGLQTHTLTTAQIPPVTPTGTVSLSPHAHNVQGSQYTLNFQGGTTAIVVHRYGAGDGGISTYDVNSGATKTLSMNQLPYGGGAHPNVQPTMVTNFILFAGA